MPPKDGGGRGGKKVQQKDAPPPAVAAPAAGKPLSFQELMKQKKELKALAEKEKAGGGADRGGGANPAPQKKLQATRAATGGDGAAPQAAAARAKVGKHGSKKGAAQSPGLQPHAAPAAVPGDKSQGGGAPGGNATPASAVAAPGAALLKLDVGSSTPQAANAAAKGKTPLAVEGGGKANSTPLASGATTATAAASTAEAAARAAVAASVRVRKDPAAGNVAKKGSGKEERASANPGAKKVGMTAAAAAAAAAVPAAASSSSAAVAPAAGAAKKDPLREAASAATAVGKASTAGGGAVAASKRGPGQADGVGLGAKTTAVAAGKKGDGAKALKRSLLLQQKAAEVAAKAAGAPVANAPTGDLDQQVAACELFVSTFQGCVHLSLIGDDDGMQVDEEEPVEAQIAAAEAFVRQLVPV